MNCEQINKINIVDFLYRIGQSPTTIKGNNYWYVLRKENTPSTKVDIGINKWFDFGINKGGKLIDLICTYFTNGNIKEAIQYVANNTNNYSHTPITVPLTTDTTTRILKVTEVQNVALIQYLRNRHIYDHQQEFIKEINYIVNDKEYFALGWQNDSNGFEVRNKYFKGCLLKKDITTILGTKNNFLDVWEGMFDFLSWLQTNKQKHKVIILNSLVNTDKVLKTICKYENVNLYLDNDQAGKEAVVRFHNKRKVQDCSGIYSPYKDMNDWVTSKT